MYWKVGMLEFPRVELTGVESAKIMVDAMVALLVASLEYLWVTITV